MSAREQLRLIEEPFPFLLGAFVAPPQIQALVLEAIEDEERAVREKMLAACGGSLDLLGVRETIERLGEKLATLVRADIGLAATVKRFCEDSRRTSAFAQARTQMQASLQRRRALRHRLGSKPRPLARPARRRVCQLSNAWMVAR